MSIDYIKKEIGQLSNAWEEFKHKNDERLNEIEKGGSADALLFDSMKKIHNNMETCKKKISDIQNSMNRPDMTNCDTQYEYDKKEFSNFLNTGKYESKALETGFPGATHNFWMIDYNMVQNSPIYSTSLMEKFAIKHVIDEGTDFIEVPQNQNLGAVWSQEVFRKPDPLFPTDRTKDTVFGPSPTDISSTIASTQISNYGLEGVCKVTTRMINNTSFDVMQYIARNAYQGIVEAQNAALINGTGTGQPTGLLRYSSSAVKQVDSSVPSILSADDIFSLKFGLDERYSNDACFMMHQDTLLKAMTLKDKNGDYIYKIGDNTTGDVTLAGSRVYTNTNMPRVGSGEFAMLFASPRGSLYTTDNSGIKITSDPFTSYPYVTVRFMMKCGFALIDTSSAAILKIL